MISSQGSFSITQKNFDCDLTFDCVDVHCVRILWKERSCSQGIVERIEVRAKVKVYLWHHESGQLTLSKVVILLQGLSENQSVCCWNWVFIKIAIWVALLHSFLKGPSSKNRLSHDFFNYWLELFSKLYKYENWMSKTY